jgi:hypothetical protein
VRVEASQRGIGSIAAATADFFTKAWSKKGAKH